MYLGIRRHLDDLGRVVIPKEIRESLNISSGDFVEISCLNGEIILKPVNVLKPSKINGLKNFIKGMFKENMYLYIFDNYKILYNQFEDEIGKLKEKRVYKDIKEQIKECKFKHIENIEFKNMNVGQIHLYSKEDISEDYIKIIKLLAYILVN